MMPACGPSACKRVEHDSVSTEMDAPAAVVKSRFTLPRFPARWAVDKPAVESLFARGLWILVPVQYYVVTHVEKGLSPDDLVPAVALSLVSLAAIFLVSCAMAWCYALVNRPDPVHGDTLSGRVRMWVVALMICLVAAYALLAASLGIQKIALSWDVPIYGDLVKEAIRTLLIYLGLDGAALDTPVKLLGASLPFALPPVQILANVIYGFMAVSIMATVLRVMRNAPPNSLAGQEPSAIMVGLIVGAFVTLLNAFAVAD
jgi:hypothetical protein